MKASRRADGVTWWSMGCASRHTRGVEQAREMASDIISEGARRLFLSGVNGEPKPKVRAIQPPPNKIEWTPEMDAALRALRASGMAIFWCAHEIGVCYQVAVMRCRELGLADRRNRGRKTGEMLAAE